MKIAVPSTHPDLTGSVEGKLGTAAHLLVIETDDMSFEVVEGPRQFYSLLPLLVGVVLLLGLLRGFVSQEKLFSLFPGSSILDALWGALLESVLTGNAVNSYVIGKGLLIAGVGLCGVTVLMLAWVSVGVIQLPAESAALGARFALVRNLAAFVMAVIMSLGVIVWQGGGI